jgi:hypothetical protein
MSHCSTKAFTMAQKKLMSSICSQEMKACSMSASLANCLSARCLFMGPNRWKSLGMKMRLQGTPNHYRDLQTTSPQPVLNLDGSGWELWLSVQFLDDQHAHSIWWPSRSQTMLCILPSEMSNTQAISGNLICLFSLILAWHIIHFRCTWWSWLLLDVSIFLVTAKSNAP